MAVLARGAVTDRPWGQTLGALGQAWPVRAAHASPPTASRIGSRSRGGAIVGAIVAARQRRGGAHRADRWPDLVDAGRRDHAPGGRVAASRRDRRDRRGGAPRRRAGAKATAPRSSRSARRARSRSIGATSSIEDQITVPVVPGSELDVRAVINLGARGNLSETRLADELADARRVVQARRPTRVPDLAQFGFTELDKPVLQELLAGANLADIENDHPELGDRGVRAIVYALAAYGACEVSATEVPSGRVRKPSTPPLRSGDSNRTDPARRRRSGTHASPTGLQLRIAAREHAATVADADAAVGRASRADTVGHASHRDAVDRCAARDDPADLGSGTGRPRAVAHLAVRSNATVASRTRRRRRRANRDADESSGAHAPGAARARKPRRPCRAPVARRRRTIRRCRARRPLRCRAVRATPTPQDPALGRAMHGARADAAGSTTRARSHADADRAGRPRAR